MQEPLAAFSPSLTQRDIYTVARLNREVRGILEGSFPLLWVEGELSNLARPSSGHIYFSLKDQAAQVRCAMFRARNQALPFEPNNGLQVLVRARVSLYEGRGDFQLIVEQMEAAGDGALRRAFELLKHSLATQGLFDEAHKRAIPTLPKRIGVITSPSGAAIRDILSVLQRRFPAIPVRVYPVPVQGEGAAHQIASALALASQRKDCDVLLLARGGGSLEDLWAFNEEAVARAIFACQIPVVTGIGHEIDFTIADFVADRRAPTPSAAAELVSPDQAEWRQLLQRQQQRLHHLLATQLHHKHQGLLWLERRLQQQHPGQRLRQQSQRLDELEQRLHQTQGALMRHAAARLGQLSAHLHGQTPSHQLEQLRQRCQGLSHQLHRGLRSGMERRYQQLQTLTRALDAVSPLATLARGYAIVSRVTDQTIIRSAQAVRIGERIEAHLAQGRLVCTVDETSQDHKETSK